MAHDRAGFGGALASAGAALLLVALRGIKRGDHRLWWTLAAAGLPGFAATIVIHAGVGYTDCHAPRPRPRRRRCSTAARSPASIHT